MLFTNQEQSAVSSQLPTLDASEYRWHPSPADSSVMQRKANGVESLVGIKQVNANGGYDFYQNIVLRVCDISALSLSKFKKAMAASLLESRFENPSISCYGFWGQNKNLYTPHIQYKSFQNDAEAQHWVNGAIVALATTKTCEELRAERNNKRRESKVQKHANSLDIFIVADVDCEDAILAPGAKIEIMSLFNHLIWDGKGRYFAGQLVQRTCKILDSGKENSMPSYTWGQEMTKLDPPLLDVLEVGLDSVGPDYAIIHKKMLDSQLRVGSSWGLSVSKTSGAPREFRHSLTIDHSMKVAEAVKSRLGPKHNTGHLGHAALILALLKHKPIPDSAKNTAYLYSPLPIDGRRYLKENRKTERYGNCQAGAIVAITRLADWAINEKDPNGIKVALEKLSKHIKSNYDYWLGQSRFMLPIAIANHNYLSDLVATSDIVPTTHAPPFCNDGRAEILMPHEVIGLSRKRLFEVDDCFGGLDVVGTNALMRMDTWKGAIRLSFYFNDGHFSYKQAQCFTADVARYMVEFIR